MSRFAPPKPGESSPISRPETEEPVLGVARIVTLTASETRVSLMSVPSLLVIRSAGIVMVGSSPTMFGGMPSTLSATTTAMAPTF